MLRFYFEMNLGAHVTYSIRDRRLGSGVEIATTREADVAQAIVDALNAAEAAK